MRTESGTDVSRKVPRGQDSPPERWTEIEEIRREDRRILGIRVENRHDNHAELKTRPGRVRGRGQREEEEEGAAMVQDSFTAAVISKAVLISLGRRGKRHHATALILERAKFRTVSDFRSGTDGVIRVEEIDASPGGGVDAATNAAIVIVTAIITIVSRLVPIGLQVIDNRPRVFRHRGCERIRDAFVRIS